MSWEAAAWLMLGGSTLLLFIGMPVALTFIAINIVGAWLYMGGEAGLMQLARSSVISLTSFSLTPIPLASPAARLSITSNQTSATPSLALTTSSHRCKQGFCAAVPIAATEPVRSSVPARRAGTEAS